MADTKEKDSGLELKFDPRTIEHLGIKMYSQLPYALAELIANAYDASATEVKVRLYDDISKPKQIVVIDNGDGMSYKEVKDNFLVIGRKRRDTDSSRENSRNRKITGKKGLGKLALFGIGKTIEIKTTKIDQVNTTIFTLDWDGILNEPSGTYRPVTSFESKANKKEHGTVITLSNLSRVTDFDLIATAASLSKLFNCFGKDFTVEISRNDGDKIKLTRDMIYTNINKEFEWDIVKIDTENKSDYVYQSKLRGKIISSKKPIRQDLRGITLYVNGRLANIPSFFGVPEAGHAFSYISGWIDADFLDEFDKDLISTDRQSLSWDLPEAEDLKKHLQMLVRFLVKDWSLRRKKEKTEKISERSGINLDEWFNKVPEEILPRLRGVISQISEKPELDDEDFSTVVNEVHALIPPYTYFHYRVLHEQVREASKIHYEAKDFYVAFQESMKRYKNKVKDKSGVVPTDDLDIVSNAFGSGTKPLETTAACKIRPNGQPFSSTTLENIEEGQKFLSMGVVKGGRNVVSHEEHGDLKATGLFTEKDCLDLLSLLSHLFKRLDESKKR